MAFWQDRPPSDENLMGLCVERTPVRNHVDACLRGFSTWRDIRSVVARRVENCHSRKSYKVKNSRQVRSRFKRSRIYAVRLVTCANQDVVYRAGYIALNKEPIGFQIPEFADRFWVYAHYDARTDEFSEIGKQRHQGGLLSDGRPGLEEKPAGIMAVVRSSTSLRRSASSRGRHGGGYKSRTGLLGGLWRSRISGRLGD
jgi:hypothetical protein